MEYFDFDLEIGAGLGREYPVAVLHSPAGDGRATMHFPFDELALKDHLKDLQIALLRSGGSPRRSLSTEEQAVQDFGARLFDALLAGDVRTLYFESKTKAAQEKKGLRLRLCIQAPELAQLPWEYLYDTRLNEYLCLSPRTPVVRYLEVAQPIQSLTVEPPLRLLGMIASPADQEALDIKREQQRMEEALKHLTAQGQISLTWLKGQTWRDLHQAMLRDTWHIFHFVGHGGFDPSGEEGAIALANDEGRTHLLHARQLARLLAEHDLHLVVLNACEGAKGSERDVFSSTAATLAQHGIPAVLAMQSEITDRAAIECTRTFYAALAEGLSVDAAVTAARTAISVGLTNSLEWGTPVLYLRSSTGVLFKKPSASPQLSVSPPLPPDGEAVETPPATEVATTKNQQGTSATRGRLSRRKFFWLAGGSVAGGAAVSVGGVEVFLWAKRHYFPCTTILPPLPLTPTPPPTSFSSLTYKGHAGEVYAVAWSPDGKYLASGGQDSTVQIWSATTGELQYTYEKHTDWVKAIAWSPDSQRLASASYDATIQVWEALTGKNSATYIGHQGALHSIAWSPDGTRIASASDDQTVQVWDPLTRAASLTYRGHSDQVHAVAWSPDGKSLASGSADKTVRVWDPKTGADRLVYYALNAEVDSLSWAPDSRYVVSGTSDNATPTNSTFQAWDALTGCRALKLSGHDRVLSVAWSPNGRLMASGHGDQFAYVWDRVGTEFLVYHGHMNWVYAVAWSPDSRWVASASADGTVQVWPVP